MLPVFMLGGLSVQIGTELDFDARALGAATTIFFAVSAAGSATAGRVVQRAGAYPGIVATATLSAASLVGIAAFASRWSTLVALLVVGGFGNAIAQPAANLLLSAEIPYRRQGLFFGVKQAAVPVSTLLAGFSVPVIGLTIGWRWAFVLVAAGSLALPLLAPRRVRSELRPPPVKARAAVDRLPLVVLGAGAMLAAAAVNSLAVFMVPSAVDAGIAESQAGYLLAIGSALGITARVVVGWRADLRTGGHLVRVYVMMSVGCVGFLLLAAGSPLTVLALATVLAFAAGWGWNGLFTFAIVRAYPGGGRAPPGADRTGHAGGGGGGGDSQARRLSLCGGVGDATEIGIRAGGQPRPHHPGAGLDDERLAGWLGRERRGRLAGQLLEKLVGFGV
jgi:predicted MFS family arabinose efflux permease